MIIAALLLGWQLAMVMIVSGFYLSVQFYKYYVVLDTLKISIGSHQFFLFMYTLMLAGTALVIFFKPRQELEMLMEEKEECLNNQISSSEEKLEKALFVKNQFIRNIAHEFQAPITGIISLAQILFEKYDKV